MEIDELGFLRDARQVASPNYDERPAGAAIDTVIVHGISLPPCQYGGPFIDDLFTNRLDPEVHPYFKQIAGLRVSSHLLIRRDGAVVQYVPLHKRAWHAGVSCFEGRERCNDFSIGIELEGCDEESYTDLQYERLAEVVVSLMEPFPAILPERVVGHCDVAPGRKTDPGPLFDWRRAHALIDREREKKAGRV